MNVRQECFDLEATGLQPRGELQRAPEPVERLVDGEAWPVGRDLKQDAARFAKVYRAKIVTVELWRNVVTLCGELVVHCHLYHVALGPESDVMDDAGPHDSLPESGDYAQVDERSRTGITRRSP